MDCVQELTKSVEVLRQDSEDSSAALREAQAALEDRHASAAQRESALEAETAELKARNSQLATQAEAAHSECCRYSFTRQVTQGSIHHAQDICSVVCLAPSGFSRGHSLGFTDSKHEVMLCRLEAALLTQQLRTEELHQELQESQATQEGLQEACAAAQSAVGAAQASKASLEAQKAELQAEGHRLQAENAQLLSRLQAMDGSRDRSVQDAENRLVDVQVCPDLLSQAFCVSPHSMQGKIRADLQHA